MLEILRVEKISKKYIFKRAFSRKKTEVQALEDISFTLSRGQLLSIIGESGSGKSTLALIIAGLLKPDSGNIFFKDKNIFQLYKQEKEIRRKIQIIFQDPYNTLNPRYTVYQTLREAILVHRTHPRSKRRDKVAEILEGVGLSGQYFDKYPHQLSGGERQRVAIARALILKPELLICDEPTSNLDVSIQAQILNLLLQIKQQEGLSMIFITHDINIAAILSQRIVVLYKGRIIEKGNVEEILNNPQDSYTKSLLSSSFIQ